MLLAAAAPLDPPSVVAIAKGPDQINLQWRPVAHAGYGYIVEIQSPSDDRYTSWKEITPIPTAAGYVCDPRVVIRDGHCNISDESGAHVYNSPNNGIPYWVTEVNYIDPQDNSPTQFIVWGLKPNTPYSFRVRSYSTLNTSEHSVYSAVATASTASYEVRYVSPSGRDTNSGSAPDPSHAWKTLSHASAAMQCGQVLIAMTGSYASDSIVLNHNCSLSKKLVVMAEPGHDAVITSLPPGSEHSVVLGGSYLVVDGIKSAASSQSGDYDFQVSGHHIALLNIETHPTVIPTFRGGVALRGSHNLLYRSYLHDAGSPDAKQNPSGNGGYVLVVEGERATDNVIWSNHLTRGGHDVSLCIRGASHNRWLNNIMDGGWGMGWEAVQGAQSNLIEGNIIYEAGQLVSFYKPAIEISSAHNTARRNIAIRPKSNALEVSALYGGDSVIATRVYNNTFYEPGACYFQSHNGGVSAYDNGIYNNNICYGFQGVATDIYLGNRTGSISHNSFAGVGATGSVDAKKPIIIWNHDGGGGFQYPKPISVADEQYNPPFSKNSSLAVDPKFVNVLKFDFHLELGSPMLSAGSAVDDPDWAFVSRNPDLGAFGITSEIDRGVRATTKSGRMEADVAQVVEYPSGTKGPFGAPELDRPTITCIGIRVPIMGDVSNAASVSVRYREMAGDVWKDALPLFRVHPEVVTGWDTRPEFAGTIFDLKPQSSYLVEIHIVDSQHGIDERKFITAHTRGNPSDPVPARVVAVRDGEELERALRAAQPGDLIELSAGVYRGLFQISAAGTDDKPIVIRGVNEDAVILDGGGCTNCNVIEVYGSGYVHIERLSIRNAERAIRFQTNGAEANVVRWVHIQDTNLGITGRPDQKDFYICDNVLVGRLKWPLFYRADNGSHADDDGIQVMGDGHVVCHNQIAGFGDAMKTAQRGARAVDFYGNDIRYSYDNGIELDEAAGNVRCFRNRFLNTYATLSVQPIYGGPAYLVRNVVVNVDDEQMKFHALGGNPPQEPSGVLAINNTFVSQRVALNVQTPAMSHFFLIANNLFVGPIGSRRRVVNWDAPFATGVFDHNGYYPEGIFYFNLWKEPVKEFASLDALRSSGLETHGVILTEPIFESGFSLERDVPAFVSAPNLSLAAQSVAVDSGAFFPNVTDSFTGQAPDLGALERGCPLPSYGPRMQDTEEVPPTGGCQEAEPRRQIGLTESTQLLARAMGSAPSRMTSTRRMTPQQVAQDALLLAASGDAGSARAMFNVTNFPQARQDDFIREAYFELRLQSLLDLAAARKCADVDQGITAIGDDDKNLPFTFYGFGSSVRRLRTQYLLAAVEAACVDAKSGRKRWERVSKSRSPIDSTDFAFPYLALAKIDPDAARKRASEVLAEVLNALAAAPPEKRALLLYHRGLLTLVLGETSTAKLYFQEAGGMATGILQYLNLEMLRAVDSRRF